jgi:hypothetical protein
MWDTPDRRRAEASSVVVRERRATTDDSRVTRLKAALQEPADQRDRAFHVAVTERSGSLEVRVSGRKASLRFVFDGMDVPPAYIRRVVNDAVERYRSALGNDLEDRYSRRPTSS